MSSLKDGSYCSIWQLHGLASVLGLPIVSVYPEVGGRAHIHVRNELNRTVQPREQRLGTVDWILPLKAS